jgi:hypothetical protein
MKSYGIRNGVRPTITTAEEGTIALDAVDKGAIFYNTDTDSLRTWDGSAFQNVGGSGGEKDFVATGAIGAGAVVGLRSDGTVEVVTDTTGSDTLGTSQVFDSVSSSEISATYDSADKKVIICYREGALTGAGTVVAGTVSGTVITFGASQIFAPNSTLQIKAVYDSTDKKIIISHMDFSDNFYGKVIVGTLSGTVFTFGTVQTFASASTNDISAVYDQTDKKVIISYRDAGNTNYGTYIVGAVSGTVITFGTEAVFNSGNTTYTSAVYDQTDKKLIVSYKNGGNNNYGTYIAGTLSGTVVTFGTAAVFESAAISYISSVYDEVDKKVIISYQNNGNSGYGTVIVGTLNGTVITFGTAQVFESAYTSYISSVYGQTGKKVIISYRDGGNSDYGTLITGTLSGTVITFGTAVVFESANGNSISSVYDQADKKAIISYTDGGNGSYGTSIIYELGSTSTNVLDTIGINTTAKVNAETATVTILAGTSGGHSISVIGDICYVNYQGTITQTLPVDAFGYKRLGIAVSATEILLDLLPTTEDIFTGSSTEIQLADGSVLATGADGEALNSQSGVPTWGAPLPPPVPKLFEFTEYTFNNCGVTGRTGPGQADADTEYAGTAFIDDYLVCGGGTQILTIPQDGSYTLTVEGAAGGTDRTGGTATQGGYASVARATFAFTKGDNLVMRVGQLGSPSIGTSSRESAGGGGGSYTLIGSTLLLASGGGGGGVDYNGATQLGGNASLTETGTSGQSSNSPGGTAGGGGDQGGYGSSYGAGGGGFVGDGQGSNGRGGLSYPNSSTGGYDGTSSNRSGDGGFGGGGAGGEYASGAGGGYSGGGGGNSSGDVGGGGASYTSGTQPIAYLSSSRTTHGTIKVVLN